MFKNTTAITVSDGPFKNQTFEAGELVAAYDWITDQKRNMLIARGTLIPADKGEKATPNPKK